jgi:lysophospholipase L1-like esterase
MTVDMHEGTEPATDATGERTLRSWAEKVAWPTLLIAVSLGAITAMQLAGWPGLCSLVGLGALLYATIWLGVVNQDDRHRMNYTCDGVRASWSAILVVIALVGIRLFGGGEHGRWTAVPLFACVGVLLISLGTLAVELRMYKRRWRKCAALTAAFVALVVGLLWVEPTGVRLGVTLAALVVVGVLATESTTEWLLLRGLGPNSDTWFRVGAVAGLVLIFVGSAFLVGAGAKVGQAVVVAIVVFTVMAFVSARSDNLILTLILSCVLIWASTSRTVPAAEVANVEPGQSFYVVFGDSYISGEGAALFQDGTNSKVKNSTHTNQCRRANSAWPLALAERHPEGLPERVLFIACSGAVTRDLSLSTSRDNAAAQLRLYEQAIGELQQGQPPGEIQPEFAFVSIGGNDALFGDIGTTCVGPGSCSDLREEFEASLVDLPMRLAAAYADVARTVGPGVPIIAVPYPEPINSESGCEGLPLDAREIEFITGYVKQLNAIIREAAATAQVEYLDLMADALRTEHIQLCSGAAAGLNVIDWHPQAGSLADTLNPLNWTHNSLHPNEIGHEAMAEAAEEWLATNDLDLTPLDEPVAVRYERHQVHGKGAFLTEHGYDAAREIFVPVLIVAFGSWLVLLVFLRKNHQKRRSFAHKLRFLVPQVGPPPT